MSETKPLAKISEVTVAMADVATNMNREAPFVLFVIDPETKEIHTVSNMSVDGVHEVCKAALTSVVAPRAQH